MNFHSKALANVPSAYYHRPEFAIAQFRRTPVYLLRMPRNSISVNSTHRTLLPVSSSHLPPCTCAVTKIGEIDAIADGKNSKAILTEMRYEELDEWVQSHGFRPGQALMLWKRLYGNGIWAHSVEHLQGLNKDLQRMLSNNAQFTSLTVGNILTSSDGTSKILFNLCDGLAIETVIIPCDRGRTTVCVSSQVGCAMNCQFCYTGRMGLGRNLTASEIVEQILFSHRLFGSITNVVFMGMGEPFQNIDNVLKATQIITHEQGLHLSPNKITVSTSGLVPQIKRFLKDSSCSLAVSLNATTDELRNWVMPINKKFSLSELLSTLREGLKGDKRKVLFEYVMLRGVNDSLEDARRLAELVRGIPCKINLIEFNWHKGSIFRATEREQMMRFRDALSESGCVVLVRYSRGDDSMAACGQLGVVGPVHSPLLKVPQQFQMSVTS